MLAVLETGLNKCLGSSTSPAASENLLFYGSWGRGAGELEDGLCGLQGASS